MVGTTSGGHGRAPAVPGTRAGVQLVGEHAIQRGERGGGEDIRDDDVALLNEKFTGLAQTVHDCWAQKFN